MNEIQPETEVTETAQVQDAEAKAEDAEAEQAEAPKVAAAGPKTARKPRAAKPETVKPETAKLTPEQAKAARAKRAAELKEARAIEASAAELAAEAAKIPSLLREGERRAPGGDGVVLLHRVGAARRKGHGFRHEIRDGKKWYYCAPSGGPKCADEGFASSEADARNRHQVHLGLGKKAAVVAPEAKVETKPEVKSPARTRRPKAKV